MRPAGAGRGPNRAGRRGTGHDLGSPTNLVAHHVKVLTGAGLVVRSRSEGDRLRTYLRLRPAALAALTPASLTGVSRVVFVCTRNSACSPLAAAGQVDARPPFAESDEDAHRSTGLSTMLVQRW
ncbi:hypothetical protein ACFY3U_12020 [Micromonospora sp. NPDC000089]|uniref:hypothetical protein n=1 Tax=unclassified Micromonospora TaxID=2617518 RepID=UPI0036BD0535